MREKRKLKSIAAKSVKLSAQPGNVDHSRVSLIMKRLKKIPKDQAIYVISKYLKGLRRKKVESLAVVESVVPLSKKQLDEIKEKLNQEYIIHKLENKINPELLGGIKIRVADTILDYSLQNKIAQVGETITT